MFQGCILDGKGYQIVKNSKKLTSMTVSNKSARKMKMEQNENVKFKNK